MNIKASICRELKEPGKSAVEIDCDSKVLVCCDIIDLVDVLSMHTFSFRLRLCLVVMVVPYVEVLETAWHCFQSVGLTGF